MKKIILSFFLLGGILLAKSQNNNVADSSTKVFLTHNNFDKISKYIKETGVSKKTGVYINNEFLDYNIKLQKNISNKEYLYISPKKKVGDISLNFRISKSNEKLVMGYECLVETIDKKDGKEIFKPIPQTSIRTGIWGDHVVNSWVKNILTEIEKQIQPGVGVPKFKDASVQKMANEYAALINEYSTTMKDSAKATELAKRAEKWSTTIQEPMKRLASNEEEMKKFTDLMQELSRKMQEAYQKNN